MRVVSDKDYARLQSLKESDARVREAFRLKAKCDTCGYQSMDYPNNSCCPLIDCRGGMEEYSIKGDAE